MFVITTLQLFILVNTNDRPCLTSIRICPVQSRVFFSTLSLFHYNICQSISQLDGQILFQFYKWNVGPIVFWQKVKVVLRLEIT